MDRKLERAVPLFGGLGPQCNAMWLGPRPTFVPSGILIHSDVWPQQTQTLLVFSKVPVSVAMLLQ